MRCFSRHVNAMALVTLCRLQSTTPSNESSTEPTSAPASAKQTKFSSSIHFKIPDGKVNEDNLPSAEELETMIPSLADLEKQIPSAEDMEKKYIFTSTAAQQAAAVKSETTGENKPLWPNCDTPEEIMDEERYGADGEVRPAPTPQQVSLAWKALGWGTLYAVIGVGVCFVVGLYACGFRSWGDFMQHLRTRQLREMEKMRNEAENSGEQAQHFTVDLTNPFEVPKQIEEIYQAIQKMAEEQQREKEQYNFSADAASSPNSVK